MQANGWCVELMLTARVTFLTNSCETFDHTIPLQFRSLVRYSPCTLWRHKLKIWRSPSMFEGRGGSIKEVNKWWVDITLSVGFGQNSLECTHAAWNIETLAFVALQQHYLAYFTVGWECVNRQECCSWCKQTQALADGVVAGKLSINQCIEIWNSPQTNREVWLLDTLSTNSGYVGHEMSVKYISNM